MVPAVYTPTSFLSYVRQYVVVDNGLVRDRKAADPPSSANQFRFLVPVDLICVGPCAGMINIGARLEHEPNFTVHPLGEKIHEAITVGAIRNVIVYPTCCEEYDATHKHRIAAAYPDHNIMFFHLDFFYRGYARSPVSNLVRCMIDAHLLEIIQTN